MRSLFGTDIPQGVQWLLALILVLALVVLFGLLLKRFAGGRLRVKGGSGRARQPRLGVVDIYDLDRQRQLVLLRRDNVEHLVMIGGPNDVVVEAAINRSGARLPLPATPLEPEAELPPASVAAAVPVPAAPAPVQAETPVTPPRPKPLAEEVETARPLTPPAPPIMPAAAIRPEAFKVDAIKPDPVRIEPSQPVMELPPLPKLEIKPEKDPKHAVTTPSVTAPVVTAVAATVAASMPTLAAKVEPVAALAPLDLPPPLKVEIARPAAPPEPPVASPKTPELSQSDIDAVARELESALLAMSPAPVAAAAKPDVAKPEPVAKPAPFKAETAQPEPKAETPRPDAIKAESKKSETAKAAPAKAEPAKAESAKTEPVKPEPTKVVQPTAEAPKAEAPKATLPPDPKPVAPGEPDPFSVDAIEAEFARLLNRNTQPKG